MHSLTVRVLRFAALALLAASCQAPDSSLVLVYPDQATFDRADFVRVKLSGAYSCDELRDRGETQLAFDAHTERPMLGQVAPGDVAFRAMVQDATCTQFLEGCTLVRIERGASVEVRVPLHPRAEQGCGAQQRCLQRDCVAVDAAAYDAAAPDAAALDTTALDGAGPDAAASDASAADAADGGAAGYQLAFVGVPDRAALLTPLAPQVRVEVRDRANQLVDTANDLITIALAADPTGSATLSGTLAQRASGGVASFDDLVVNSIGNGFALRARASGLLDATSLPFAVWLRDDFEDGALNRALWSPFTEATVAIRERSGQLEIAPPANTTCTANCDNTYGGVVSEYFDFTNRCASVEVKQVLNRTAAGGGSDTEYHVEIDGDNNAGFFIEGRGLYAYLRIAGDWDGVRVDYDSVTQRHLRVRHQLANNALHWEFSPDGIAWTEQRYATSTLQWHAASVLLMAGVFDSMPDPGTAIYDNVLVAPCP